MSDSPIDMMTIEEEEVARILVVGVVGVVVAAPAEGLGLPKVSKKLLPDVLQSWLVVWELPKFSTAHCLRTAGDL